MSKLKRYEGFEQLKADTKAADPKNIARKELELENVFEELRSFKVIPQKSTSKIEKFEIN